MTLKWCEEVLMDTSSIEIVLTKKTRNSQESFITRRAIFLPNAWKVEVIVIITQLDIRTNKTWMKLIKKIQTLYRKSTCSDEQQLRSLFLRLRLLSFSRPTIFPNHQWFFFQQIVPGSCGRLSQEASTLARTSPVYPSISKIINNTIFSRLCMEKREAKEVPMYMLIDATCGSRSWTDAWKISFKSLCPVLILWAELDPRLQRFSVDFNAKQKRIKKNPHQAKLYQTSD